MIACFPTPYPDELLYSVIARLSDWFAFRGQRLFIEAVFGTQYVVARMSLPGYLDALIANLPRGHCYSVDQLIDHHTLFPYYTWFFPHELRQQLRAEMQERNVIGVRHQSATVVRNIVVREWFRICPECLQIDIQQWGEAYWHRTHQLPGILVCPVHGCLLQQPEMILWNTKTPYTFFSLSSVWNQRSLLTIQVPQNEIANLYQIAQDVKWFLEGEQQPDLMKLHERYISAFIDQGLQQRRDNVEAIHLLKAFKQRYSQILLELLECDLSEFLQQNWLIRMTEKYNAVYSPLHHVLLIRFLKYTPQSFFN